MHEASPYSRIAFNFYGWSFRLAIDRFIFVFESLFFVSQFSFSFVHSSIGFILQFEFIVAELLNNVTHQFYSFCIDIAVVIIAIVAQLLDDDDDAVLIIISVSVAAAYRDVLKT